ncbi:asparagine synthase-related protein [Streptomyces sp. NPDC093707]|uniref:asparagine synthase-related protein n=1 Tax=Streptomyces sp. NPDC093707 TaxID=3154984 RepID=UPI00344EFA04
MHEEWMIGCGGADHMWAGERQIEGMPRVAVGGACRIEVVADQRARVALVGDVFLPDDAKSDMLDAAAEGRWGPLTHCPGSYWVVAENGRNQFICGDLSGFRSVFYAEHGGHTIWSTSARQLAERRHAPIDLAMMAAQVVMGAEHWFDRTVYEGVAAVPGGYGLLLGGARPQLVAVSDTRPTFSLPEGAPAFGETLRAAVHDRMRAVGGRAGADVSGGLDSTAVGILAAEVGEVQAVTYADSYTSAEDLRFARRAAAHMGIDLEVGHGDVEHLPFAWRASQPVPDQPAAASLTMAQHSLYLEPASGLGIHFTGNGGDVVLDSSSAAWVGMVQSGDRRAARREVARWARARNRAPRDLWRAVTRTAGMGYADALEEAALQLEAGGSVEARSGVWTWCHVGQSSTWLTTQGRHQVAALLRGAATSTTAPLRADLAEQQASLRLVGADARDTASLATAWGVRPVHPYLDNRVVRAAFRIDPVERHGVTSFKPLLAAAVPHLPRWLTERTSKGSFSRQCVAGMIRHRQAVAQLFRSSPLTVGGLLDAESAIRALAEVEGARFNALYDLQRLTMACQWLDAVGQQDTQLGVAC